MTGALLVLAVALMVVGVAIVAMVLPRATPRGLAVAGVLVGGGCVGAGVAVLLFGV